MNRVKKLLISLFIIMLIVIFITNIFALKVSYLQKDIASMRQEINVKQKVRLSLRARWNFLNNKEYIEDLAKKHLPNYK